METVNGACWVLKAFIPEKHLKMLNLPDLITYLQICHYNMATEIYIID